MGAVILVPAKGIHLSHITDLKKLLGHGALAPAPEGPTEQVPKVEAELGLAELPEPAVADMKAFKDLPDGKFGVFNLPTGGKGFRHVKTHTETMEQKNGQGMELITDTVDGKTTQKNYDIKNGKLVPVKRPRGLTKMQEEGKKEEAKAKPPAPKKKKHVP